MPYKMLKCSVSMCDHGYVYMLMCKFYAYNKKAMCCPWPIIMYYLKTS